MVGIFPMDCVYTAHERELALSQKALGLQQQGFGFIRIGSLENRGLGGGLMNQQYSEHKLFLGPRSCRQRDQRGCG